MREGSNCLPFSMGVKMFAVEHSKEVLLESINVFTNKSFY